MLKMIGLGFILLSGITSCSDIEGISNVNSSHSSFYYGEGGKLIELDVITNEIRSACISSEYDYDIAIIFENYSKRQKTRIVRMDSFRMERIANNDYEAIERCATRFLKKIDKTYFGKDFVLVVRR